ncbi:hypothetical protein GH714_022337 [Hevea brasiliensis]|uniref:Uncharacterized protein n=1 Tax=Hevea brasiliensis TaxID=3981 RepID=A0A6A6MXY5_HEVBR|nr:hypothetical protein GH714_022337 [Hevea brasiliensis]
MFAGVNFRANGPTGKQESCREEQPKMRRRRRRGNSREPSRVREDLGDLEKRLTKVELHLIDGEERFEEMDTRLVELDGRMEELQGDMQGALNAAIDKLASECESLRLSHMEECAALRDENRSLKEQLDRAMGKLKEVEQQVSLVAMAVAQRGVATTSGASLVIPSRVEVPKPSVYSGTRNVKEIDNFLWSLKQYFRVIGITDDAKKVDMCPCIWWILRWFGGDEGTATCRKGFAPLPHGMSSRESSRGNSTQRMPQLKQGPDEASVT